MFGKLYRFYGPQFLQGKIYKLVCKTTGDIYIGSTYCSLKQRLRYHLNGYNWYLDKGKNYGKSFEILANDNYEMQLIEAFPFYGKYFLNKREGWYQRNIKCINTQIAGRDQKQYDLDNYPKLKEYRKNWKKNNPEKVKASLIRENRGQKKPCPLCGKIMRKDTITRHQKSSRCIKK